MPRFYYQIEEVFQRSKDTNSTAVIGLKLFFESDVIEFDLDWTSSGLCAKSKFNDEQNITNILSF